jgi:hypothetical protein
MKNIALAIAITALCATPASAQSVVSFPSDPNALSAAYSACGIASTVPTICFAAPAAYELPRLVIGFFNGAPIAQTVTVTCTDGVNPFTIGPLGITQIVILPSPGFPIAGKLTCTASGAPSGAIYILVH